MKVGKILFLGCIGIVAVVFVVLIGGVLVFGFALHNFANRVNTANDRLGSGAAACVLSQSEASSVMGTPMSSPVSVPIIGCTYAPLDNQNSHTVVLMRVRRTASGQTSNQLLQEMTREPSDFTGGTLTPVAGVGDSAVCEDLSGTYAHIFVVKGNAVGSVLMTGGAGVDCNLAARWGMKVAGKL